MRTIEISDKDDKALDLVAPEYLKGERKSAQRVAWAIEQLSRWLKNDHEHPDHPVEPKQTATRATG